MRILYIISLFLCFAAFSACSNSDAIEIKREGAPALWKVTTNDDNIKTNDKKTILYIFGTIHLLPKGAQWDSAQLEFAINDSDQLIVETTGLEDTANVSKIFTSMATDEKTTPITERLSGDNLNALKQVIDDKGLSKSALSKMETWAASLAISNSFTSDMGLERALGVETVLTKRFRNKPIEGLETIPSQFAIFDDLSEQDQRNMLSAVVNNADDSKASFLRLLNAWLDGNSDALLDESKGGILTSPNVREALLDGRNRKWTQSLSERLDSSDKKHYFVAVGAAHLVGENGVPELLKSAGYSVKRIQ